MDIQLKRIRQSIEELDTMCAYIEREGLASASITETVEHHINDYYPNIDEIQDAMNMLKHDFGRITLAEAYRLYLDEYNDETRIKAEEDE